MILCYCENKQKVLISHKNGILKFDDFKENNSKKYLEICEKDSSIQLLYKIKGKLLTCDVVSCGEILKHKIFKNLTSVNKLYKIRNGTSILAYDKNTFHLYKVEAFFGCFKTSKIYDFSVIGPLIKSPIWCKRKNEHLLLCTEYGIYKFDIYSLKCKLVHNFQLLKVKHNSELLVFVTKDYEIYCIFLKSLKMKKIDVKFKPIDFQICMGNVYILLDNNKMLRQRLLYESLQMQTIDETNKYLFFIKSRCMKSDMVIALTNEMKLCVLCDINYGCIERIFFDFEKKFLHSEHLKSCSQIKSARFGSTV